jgi:three-Cys-motif partner protein
MLELSPWYDGREQTYVKHYVLEQYLLRFGPIIGSWCNTITYIDSFAGPWRSRHPEYRDTSFQIAVECLRHARDFVREKSHRDLRLRCLFLEKDEKKFPELREYAQSLSDIEAEALNDEFEAAVPAMLQFVRGATDAFTFLFVDPTGWAGFAMESMAPLLRVRPGEVLINLMTSHMRRFLKTEKSAASFRSLFGRDIREQLEGLVGEDREEKAVGEYMRGVKSAGEFLYVGSAIVFKPEVETPYFHLIYATRNNKGVSEFKEVEKKLFNVANDVRSAAKERRRTVETGMSSLFPPQAIHKSTAMLDRRTRYLGAARERVLHKLIRSRSVRYEIVWRMALAYPLVWESDLKEWIEAWRSEGKLIIPTLTGKRRVPKPEVDTLEWIG